MLDRMTSEFERDHRDRALTFMEFFALVVRSRFAIFLACAAIVIFFLSLANAQEPGKDLNISVTAAELAVIGKALGTFPYSDVAPLMNKLQTQFIAQSVPRRAPDGGGSGVGGGSGPK